MNKILMTVVMSLAFAAPAFARDAKVTMRQPYDAAKTPVLFVHGLWDTKQTWLPMLHALERDPALSAKYQFWRFEYDTYMPFWVGAAELRSELDRINREYPKHKKIVLVGHSMGGLISRMVLTDYGGKARTDVQRAIFIAAPHRGSDWGKLALTPALDALSKSNAAYPILDSLKVRVPFHLIVGKFDELVDSSSSHLDGAVSKKVVNTMHAAHWTQQGINEVKRILTEAHV
jgi:triacylglycerol esterase/lipase EstA (alpha/beta hydrolase family)